MRAAAADGGADLRFIAEDGKTVLPYQVEKWDGLLNEAFSEAGAMPSMQELLHPDQWCERIAGNG